MKKFLVTFFIIALCKFCSYAQTNHIEVDQKQFINTWRLDSIYSNNKKIPLTLANQFSSLILKKEFAAELVNETGYSEDAHWKYKPVTNQLSIITLDDYEILFKIVSIKKDFLIASIINPATKEIIVSYLSANPH